MERAVATLIHFSRVVSEAKTPDDALAFLAEAAMQVVGGDASIVARVQADGTLGIATTHRLGGVALGAPPADALVTDLGEWALAATKGAFSRAHTRVMISNADLFGALIVLFARPTMSEPESLEIVDALVDLAATSLAKSLQFDALQRSLEELHAAQDSLVRSEKLRALGQMAAGVSHDLKNILNPLWLHLQLLERAGAKRPADVAQTAAEMKQVLTRGLQTVERLRDYARQAPESRAESVDLDAVVAEAAEIAKARMSSRANRPSLRLTQELGAPRQVMGRATDIVNAVVNLAVNAIDALVDGGTVVLRTGSDATSSWVEVADDGPGMSPEVERKVFEPFFTTKGDEGTGLGLAMVFACMQRHNGSVELATAPGKGARFTLRFPSFD